MCSEKIIILNNFLNLQDKGSTRHDMTFLGLLGKLKVLDRSSFCIFYTNVKQIYVQLWNGTPVESYFYHKLL